MKNAFSFILLLTLLTQTFSRSLALADYMVNLEAYKNACINKAKPKLECNVKCQLLKKTNNQEDNKETNTPAPKFNQQELILSSKSFFPTIEMFGVQKSNFFYAYSSSFNSNYISSIFHPPGV
jgi:hypothetical protein